MVRLDKGFRMKLDLADPEQLKVYFYGHYHERYEADLVQRLLTEDDVFWDVGANVGYFTLVAATALANRGQIVAFEPGKNAYARLTENLSLNSYRNIQTFPVAVTDREGEAVLHLAGDIADSSASLYQAAQTQAGQEVCRTVALDHFLDAEGLRPPDLIKLDAEGAELAVLQGAQGLLAASPPLWLMEMEEKNLRGRGGQQSRGGAIPHRLRLPGGAPEQRPLVRHRRPGGRQGPEHLLVQSRGSRPPAESGAPAGHRASLSRPALRLKTGR